MHWNTASCGVILLKEKVAYFVIPLFCILGFSVPQSLLTLQSFEIFELFIPALGLLITRESKGGNWLIISANAIQ